MSVHYKFKSNLDHDTVTFDGLNISVADLKKAILHQKKIGKSSDFDLQITNAQTKEVYDNDDMLVPKNTSVIVARVPVQGGTKKNWEKPDLPLPIDDDDLGMIRYDRIVKNADLVNANTSEEDKVKAMITQSSQEYDPSKFVKSRSMTGPLPPTYTCFRCGKQGHWIKNCPTNNPDVKRSTGIPRSFMVPVDGPEHKGALLTSSGDYAVPLIDHQAYKEVKKEKPPFLPQEEPTVEPEREMPEELKCMCCNDLLQDAVLIPCCGNSFCDECVRTVLLESDNHECPVCHETDVSPNTLIPNRFLRTAVANYKNESGYTRVKRADSPQPSPDSTVHSNPQPADNVIEQLIDPANIKKEVNSSSPTPENATPRRSTEDESDAAPGTPLADEPSADHNLHAIQAIGQDRYNKHHDSRSRDVNDFRERDSRRYRGRDEPRPISTIGTITNTRNSRLGLPRQQFSSLHQRDDNDYLTRERDDYGNNRYDKRDRRSDSHHHIHYDRSQKDTHYRSHEYPSSNRGQYHSHGYREDNAPNRQERYTSPHRTILIPPPIPPLYPPPPIMPPAVLPPPVFPAQPPPPGVNIAPQPPPPGVGPLPPMPAPVTFVAPPVSVDHMKEARIVPEKSIDDKIEEFQRKLQKRERNYSRSRSRSRSSRTRTTYSSKSWSSSSRSITRSRSRTPFTSRSRSRSYTHSRSRSWSKKRSYSRSRSRSRTPARSRSRSRVRIRRRLRTRSRSYSPRAHRPTSRKETYSSSSRSYDPRYHPYGSSAPMVPIPLQMRPSAYPPHIHPMHSVILPVTTSSSSSRSIDHHQYPPKYHESQYHPPVYQQQQKYERIVRYEKYPRHEEKRYEEKRYEEKVGHRIPGYIGERPQDYKPRYRSVRENQHKDIKELPRVTEEEIRTVHVKESPVKTKEVTSTKHKKHHHHKVKKQQENSVKSEERTNDASIKVNTGSDKDKISAEPESVKSSFTDKVKEKKHKHKTVSEQIVKKKKKDKSHKSDSDSKVKLKKKKTKLKIVPKEKIATPPLIDSSAKPSEVEPENITLSEPTEEKYVIEQDILDIFADDLETVIVEPESKPEEQAVLEPDNVVENAEESSMHSEEEIEEEIFEDETILHVDIPGISKWEREESDDEAPQQKISSRIIKEEKDTISSDIISRAENVLLSKQFKSRIEVSESSNKEIELKSVVKTEPPASDVLRVIISNKRSTKEDIRVKSEKSHTHSVDHHHSERRIVTDKSKDCTKSRDKRRHQSPIRKVILKDQKDNKHDDNRKREERKQRFEESLKVSKSKDIDKKREANRSLEKISKLESHKASSSTSSSDKLKAGEKLSHSDSAPLKRKHSPIKPPGISPVKVVSKKEYHHDELLKFEPDYDEFSDVEAKRQQEHSKRKATEDVGNKKKVVKVEKLSKVVDKSSSPSSSYESESSEEENYKQKHKKSARHHKKHKKHHKHKHKHKKSHKSTKQRE